MSNIQRDPTQVQDESTTATTIQLDYTPGYQIQIEPQTVLEGASVISELPSQNTDHYQGINVDVYDENQVIGVYNKYKDYWEADQGVGAPFVYTADNATKLLQIVKVHLYFDQLEGSNVRFDANLKQYVVTPIYEETPRIDGNEYADKYSREYRYPTLGLGTGEKIYRDDQGQLLRDPSDQTSVYIQWDFTDQAATWAIYSQYGNFWIEKYGNVEFTYTLENAQKLSFAVNSLIYPYEDNLPDSGKTLREEITAFYSSHPMLSSGVVTDARLDMPEYRVSKSLPDSQVMDDGVSLSGWYDMYSPYATGKNRF